MLKFTLKAPIWRRINESTRVSLDLMFLRNVPIDVTCSYSEIYNTLTTNPLRILHSQVGEERNFTIIQLNLQIILLARVCQSTCTSWCPPQPPSTTYLRRRNRKLNCKYLPTARCIYPHCICKGPPCWCVVAWQLNICRGHSLYCQFVVGRQTTL